MGKKYRDWEEDEYRSFKKPKKVEKDKFNKHRKAIYDMLLDNEDDDDYFDERYSVEEYDEEDDRF